MISETWKSLLLKNKSIFNQLVYLHKQNHPSFNEGLIETFFHPYYGSLSSSIPNPSLETAVTSFENLLTLLQKGYFREIEGKRETSLLNLISNLKSPLNENFSLTLSYIINATSKNKDSLEDKFLNRLEQVSGFIQSLADLKFTLLVLSWLSGLAQYRSSALENFNFLPDQIQKIICSDLKMEIGHIQSYFEKTPFGNFQIDSSNEIRYKIISGYPLLGGDFFTLPVLKMGSENLLVFANGNYYALDFDLFGESLFHWDGNATDLPNQPLNPFWKTIITKFFSDSSITSYFQTEHYCAISLNQSYSVFVFYRAVKT